MRRLRDRRVRLGLLVAAVVILVVALETTEPRLGDQSVLGRVEEKKGPIVDAACDVDGVHVSYDASYRGTPATAGYRVVTASVEDVAATCAGATVTVRLLDGEQELATGTTAASGATVPVSFTSPPAAREVTRVAVEIAGGTIPVPAECGGMTFDRFLVLTPAADDHPGSKDRDLVYGLGGADTIRGDNQHDCLDGQAGPDLLLGDNHNDVLLGGAGDDTLEGGGHDDVLVGGDGNDTLRGGNGRDDCRGGAGVTVYVSCEVRS